MKCFNRTAYCKRKNNGGQFLFLLLAGNYKIFQYLFCVFNIKNTLRYKVRDTGIYFVKYPDIFIFQNSMPFRNGNSADDGVVPVLFAPDLIGVLETCFYNIIR